MADELELTEERIEFDRQVDIQKIRDQAAKFDKGQEGECFLCGEWFARVVKTEKAGEIIECCGKCRDKHGLK